MKLARNWKGITQEGLAFDLNISQKQVSEIEIRETIEETMLSKIASSLQVPVDFLKNFDLDEVMNVYRVINKPDLINIFSENLSNTVSQSNTCNQEKNYNYLINDIKDLYNKLLTEKDKQIKRFEKQINTLQKDVEILKEKLNKFNQP